VKTQETHLKLFLTEIPFLVSVLSSFSESLGLSMSDY
jgi:hypothetical protein